MKLFHFSSESNIEIFRPRVKHNRKDMPPVVWAIDQEHEFTFYFPRECPRIVITRSDDMSDEDLTRFFGVSSANKIVTVETHWYKAINEGTIYKYTLPGDSFKLFAKTAGYYISEETIIPEEMQPLDHLLDRLMDMNIEVRFTPSLHPLRDAILRSSIQDFGIHRFENAR
ncbi:hypothetical protein E0485_05170 [Paenibacillus albiflavus]|uniref:Uncharacterized protein n=1 Tax=Paenibacillus albiflavus TaxID=2545760 RepID=A0A4V2WPG5_9BACL|nr:DUF6886 family protein [Paenibacillus albiflavus]TCZ79262.1 hypothetical protein E0485_05170 [Paenibacillus albiflavus]